MAASYSPCLIAQVYGESFSFRTGLKWSRCPGAVPDHGLADVRPHDLAAVDERRVGDGELERAHLQGALADREVDRLALRPREAEPLLEVRAGRGR